MINVVKEKIYNQDNTNIYYIGTYNGIFHCDEVVAIAMMEIILEKVNASVNVIRSRDMELLKRDANILIDVGFGQFDHHQKGGNGERSNGVKYASAGLIWNKFGEGIVNLLSNKLETDEITEIANIIDQEIVQKIDMEDNGQLRTTHPFQFIKSFLPSWNEEADYDKNFEECVNVVKDVLTKVIKNYISVYLAKKEINNRINDNNYHIENMLILPNQTIPWEDIIINLNENGNEIDFVVFKYPNGGYAIQCVPKSIEDKFSQRISFPEEWAGETINLPNITSLKSATFCHNGRFFARADLFEDIIEMGRMATNKYKNRNK